MQTFNDGGARPVPIQKVPLLLLKEEKNTEDYIPKVVSIGPYHHGKPELGLAEAFKTKALKIVLSGSERTENLYCEEIKNEIIRIRNCYEQDSVDKYSDCELARMMLLDACFIIIHMETSQPPAGKSHQWKQQESYFHMLQNLGMLTTAIVLRDLFLLENQIPFWIVRLLITSRYTKDEGEKIINRYLNMTLFGEIRQKRSSPPGNAGEELHLLEVFHRLVVFDCVQLEKTCLSFKRRLLCCFRVKDENRADTESGADPLTVTNLANSTVDAAPYSIRRLLGCFRVGEEKHGAAAAADDDPATSEGDAKIDIKKYIHSFRSATDLKAKGIYFEPSSTQSLKDVKFKSYFFCAQLELPTWCVSIYTKVFFLNMIAYEFSPNNPTGGVVTSYISLMKSLIESPEDVKELREKKILFNKLGSDEEVLKVYKDINTYGANNPQIFQDVQDKIEAHHNSKIKTWIAELIDTRFRTPWTVIALLAAMTLLALASVQVYYAVHRKSQK